MITTDDTRLSKTSYADKDFASIYPDLLDLVKDLTTKWDPSLSNESDPGVVLLKAGAFLADHLNYNIDKNTLERFLPSATQDKSVRNIVETNGYTPRYYVSATGDITFSYTPDDDTTFTAATIPAFTLTVSNEDGDVTYTQCDPLVFSNANVRTSAKFIQGRLEELTINGESKIYLENIDSNNRLYFTVKNIAQNGVYVRNYTGTTLGDYWKRENYLLTQPKNTQCYKVDYDSKLNLPYIEFPSDIANIIGSGLYIQYIVTNGASGNVSAKALSVMSVRDSDGLPTWLTGDLSENLDFISCNNLSSITNGKDPETIDEMYQSFKKVVGTFDTLVTCDDYSNALYNSIEDITNNPYFSNAAVSDIKTDFNKAIQIPSYDEYGVYYETSALSQGIESYKLDNSGSMTKGTIKYDSAKGKFMLSDGTNWSEITSISYKDFVSASAAMSPYDLAIYALQAISMSDYVSANPSRELERSFLPITTTDNGVAMAKSLLDETKCIAHTYNDPKSGDVYTFNNYIPLNVTVIPYNKVTEEEKDEIIDNIFRAITENFNARNLDFGEELDYDAVLNVINNADDRIKSIRLEDFTDTKPTARILTDGSYNDADLYTGTYTDGTKLIVDVVAKNVLAGRLCLFEFDDEFNYVYGQSDATIYDDVATIAPESQIVLKSSTITSNSSAVTKTEYTFSGMLRLEMENNGTSAISVAANSSYKMPIDDPSPTLYVTTNVTSSGDETEDSLKYTFISTGEDNTDIYYSLVNVSDSAIVLSLSGSYLKAIVDSEDVKITKEVSASDAATSVAESTYTIRENEYVNIAYPNYSTTTTYPVYCNYRYEVPSGQENSEDYVIKADADTHLKQGCYLYLQWTTDSVANTKCYQAGEVVQANFDLYPINSEKAPTYTSVKSYKDHDNVDTSGKFCTLSASQNIYERDLLLTKLTTSDLYCHWIMSNGSNNLFAGQSTDGIRSVILGSGEYFIYANKEMDTMVILGAGTKIYTSVGDTRTYITKKITTIENITSDGFNAFSNSSDWEQMDFSKYNLNLQEMSIVTLSEGNLLDIKYSTNPDNSTSKTLTYTATWNQNYASVGDVDGDGEVDTYDSVLLLNYLNGTETWPSGDAGKFAKLRSDINHDGSVDYTDANLIVKYDSGAYTPPYKYVTYVQVNGFAGDSDTITITSTDSNFQYQKAELFGVNWIAIYSNTNTNPASGATLTITCNPEPYVKVLSNTWQTFTNTSITYTIDGETSTLPYNDDGYLIRSRLDLSLSDQGQELLDGQTITISYGGSDTSTILSDCSVQCSADLSGVVGDTEIDLSNLTTNLPKIMKYQAAEPYLVDYKNVTESNTVLQATLSSMKDSSDVIQLYKYEDGDYSLDPDASSYSTYTVAQYIALENPAKVRYYKPTLGLPSGITKTAIEIVNGSCSVAYSSTVSGAKLPFTYTNNVSDLDDPDRVYIIPIYIEGNLSKSLKVSVSATSGTSTIANAIYVKEYASDTSCVSEFTITDTGMHLFELVPQKVGELKYSCVLTVGTDDDYSDSVITATIFNPVVVNGINENLITTNAPIELAEVVSRIKSLVSISTKPDTKIYWINQPDNSMAIQDCKLDSQAFLYDKNNVINYLTMSHIDIDNSNIDIHKSMRNY